MPLYFLKCYDKRGDSILIRIHQPVPPMIVQIATEIPKQKHIHQLKVDSFRCLLSYDHQRGVKLFTRRLKECTAQIPELQVNIPVKQAIFDGEIIVLQNGKMILEHSLRRRNASRASEIQKAQREMPRTSLPST